MAMCWIGRHERVSTAIVFAATADGWGNSAVQIPAQEPIPRFLASFEFLRGKKPLMNSVEQGAHLNTNQSQPGTCVGIGHGITQRVAANPARYGNHGSIDICFAPQNLRITMLSTVGVDILDAAIDRRAANAVSFLFPRVF